MSGNLRERVAAALHEHQPEYADFRCSCGHLIRRAERMTPGMVFERHQADAVLVLLAQEWRERRWELVAAAWRAKFPMTQAPPPPSDAPDTWDPMIDAIGRAFFGVSEGDA